MRWSQPAIRDGNELVKLAITYNLLEIKQKLTVINKPAVANLLLFMRPPRFFCFSAFIPPDFPLPNNLLQLV